MLSRISSARFVSRRYTCRALVFPYVRYASRKVVPFLLADIGEGITECEIIKWSVKASTPVQTFDTLCEVQSDKATVEITSPHDGVIKEIMVKEGEIAKVGSGLCLIEIEEDEEDGKITEAVQPVPVEQKESHEGVSFSPSPVEEQPTPVVKRKHPLDPSHEGSSKAVDAHVLSTPSVRHFARQSGILDMSVLAPGSGRDGRVEKKDVEAYLKGTSTAQDGRKASIMPQLPQNDVQLELGRTRYAMWKSMTKSLEIPHFGYSSILDLSALNALIPAMNTYIPPTYNPPAPLEYPPSISPQAIWGSTPPPSTPSSDPSTHYTRLTILPLLLKALSRAMQEWPIFRSSLNPRTNGDERPSLTIRPHADIAIAVSTSTGLYTPVIQAVDTKNPYEIMGELRRFQSLGRQSPAGFSFKEMPKRGATISVSNVGAIGKGEFAAPLLVPGGGVAIVAIGRAKWVERQGQKRLEVGVSWSADHRIVEGAEMAAFVETWRSWVEDPARLIGDGR